MYAYRNTRAHNSILVNGMGQRIGTEGYGWIPRYYEGTELSYVVGDASNAYGEVISPLWLERGRLSGTNYTPENGWDKISLISSGVMSCSWVIRGCLSFLMSWMRRKMWNGTISCIRWNNRWRLMNRPADCVLWGGIIREVFRFPICLRRHV